MAGMNIGGFGSPMGGLQRAGPRTGGMPLGAGTMTNGPTRTRGSGGGFGQSNFATPPNANQVPTGSGYGGWAQHGENGVGPQGHFTGYGGSHGPITGYNASTGEAIRGFAPQRPWDINEFGGGQQAGPRGPSVPSGPMGGLIAEQPMPPQIGGIDPIDDSTAVREAYARAKDTAGQQGRAALDALMDVQGARGIVGSGIGVNEAGGVIQEGARQLGDFNREQAIQRVENERWRQGTNYQGNINQRGQNMNWQNMEQGRRRYNAENSPYGHIQGAGVNPVPTPYPRY